MARYKRGVIPPQTLKVWQAIRRTTNHQIENLARLAEVPLSTTHLAVHWLAEHGFVTIVSRKHATLKLKINS